MPLVGEARELVQIPTPGTHTGLSAPFQRGECIGAFTRGCKSRDITGLRFHDRRPKLTVALVELEELLRANNTNLATWPGVFLRGSQASSGALKPTFGAARRDQKTAPEYGVRCLVEFQTKGQTVMTALELLNVYFGALLIAIFSFGVAYLAMAYVALISRLPLMLVTWIVEKIRDSINPIEGYGK